MRGDEQRVDSINQSIQESATFSDGFEIVSERTVPDNVPFERMSILYYRKRVNVNVDVVSDLEFGITIRCDGDRARESHKIAKVSIEVKQPVSTDQVEKYYRDRVDNGDFDKELQPILELNLKKIKQKKRAKRAS